MPPEPQPFTRIEPGAQAGEATVIHGWRDGDGSESVILRLPLRSALRALFDELNLAPRLLPTGVVALDADALPAGQFADLMAAGSLPQVPLNGLVRGMLDELSRAPDTSDQGDLEHLVQEFERAARAVRDALSTLKSGA